MPGHDLTQDRRDMQRLVLERKRRVAEYDMQLEPWGWQLTNYRQAVETYVEEGTVESYKAMVDSVTPHVAEFLSRLEGMPKQPEPAAPEPAPEPVRKSTSFSVIVIVIWLSALVVWSLVVTSVMFGAPLLEAMHVLITWLFHLANVLLGVSP